MSPMTSTSSEPATPLPLILVTGFLGAGKTTLLLKWLRDSPATGMRVGIVMNEFGAESVDSQLVQRPGLPIRQVDGGCVCCAPDTELDRACAELVRSGLCDYVILETSGLADPDAVIDLLTDPDLAGLVRLQAVVTVLDGQWFLRSRGATGDTVGEWVLARRQVQFASVVALSRCDLLSSEALDGILPELRSWNPSAEVVRLPYNMPELGVLLNRTPGSIELPEAEAAAAVHLHGRYRSLSWVFPAAVSRKSLMDFLRNLDPKVVVRAKGFVRLVEAAGQVFVFQMVWGHVLLEPFPAKPDPRCIGVVIGPDLDAEAFRSRIRSLLGPPRIALRPLSVPETGGA